MKRKIFLLVVLVGIFLLLNPGIGQADYFVLTGNYLQVSVGSGGALIDDDATVGLKFDPTGSGDFSGPDFIMPGSPFEFYSVGIDGDWYSAGYDAWDGINPFDMTTIDNSGSGTLRADSTGGTFYDLGLSQALYFDADGSVIHFEVTLTNNSTSETMYNVVYARGVDPDMDWDLFGDDDGDYYDTVNWFEFDRVGSQGPYSGLILELVDLTGGGIQSIDGGWNEDPYMLLTGMNDGDGDNTINLAWSIGDLGPGESALLEFDYVIEQGEGGGPSPVPLPAAVWLLGSGLVGLVGLRRKITG